MLIDDYSTYVESNPFVIQTDLNQELSRLEAEADYIENELWINQVTEYFNDDLYEIRELIEACNEKIYQIEDTMGGYREILMTDVEFYLEDLKDKITSLQKKFIHNHDFIYGLKRN